MRMPWNFLSGLRSRKTSEDRDVAKLPAPSVISLKIRVADSDLPAQNPTLVASPFQEKLQSESAEAPEARALASVEGEAESLNEDIHYTKTDADELGGSENGETQATFDEISASNIASAEIAEEPRIDTVSETIRTIQAKEMPISEDNTVRQIAVTAKRVLRPPIIDLPSTRSRAASGDMAELDLEIAELRRVLSAKLSVQNEQLRQLLRRFPDS